MDQPTKDGTRMTTREQLHRNPSLTSAHHVRHISPDIARVPSKYRHAIYHIPPLSGRNVANSSQNNSGKQEHLPILIGFSNESIYRAAHRKPVSDRNRSLGCLMIMITVPK